MSNGEKFYIGISLGFNSSAAIIGTDSGVLCAISQERLNREKNTKQLPLDAIRACIETAVEKIGHDIIIEKVIYSHYEDLSEAYLLKNVPEEVKLGLIKLLGDAKEITDNNLDKAEWAFGKLIANYIEWNTNSRLMDEVIHRVEHHTAHAYSCIPVYSRDMDFGLSEIYSMTADGFGDGYSGRIMRWNSLKLQDVISQVRVIDSPALVYQFFTGALGFKEHQHEGKVTGLAAHCEKNPERALKVYHDLLVALTGKEELDEPQAIGKVEYHKGVKYEYGSSGFWVDINRLLPLTEEQQRQVECSTIIDFARFLRLKNTVYKFVKDRLGEHYDKDNILGMLQGTIKIPDDMINTPWELAYAVQMLAEKCIVNWLQVIPTDVYHCYRPIELMMAGGLVANVKLNQRIKDTGIFKKIFVSPPMGDEGTALGSVMAYMVNESLDYYDLCVNSKNYGPNIIINGGTNINYYDSGYAEKNEPVLKSIDDVVSNALIQPNLKVMFFKDKSKLIDKVTDLLADNKIVHWCQGYEEFGPRALMNHSTLYTAEDPNGTHTLNQAMGRSEYMPYCPVCKNTSADELFINWKPGEESCRFMAMTMHCKAGVAEKYRGGVHVDNTARAQFVYEKDKFTKDAWNILDSYEKKTGNKMLINTSFNIHNSPTCNLAGDCWASWLKSGRVGAALVIGNYMFLNL